MCDGSTVYFRIKTRLNYMSDFPHYRQLDLIDCGPTCLRMIAKYYKKNYSIQYFRKHSFISRNGVSMLGISDVAEQIGFRTRGVKITLEQLRTEVPLPCVLHWNQNLTFTIARRRIHGQGKACLFSSVI